MLLQVKSEQTIDIGHVRSEVDSLKFGDAQIQYIGSGACDTPVHSCVLIRVQPKPGQSGEQAAQSIRDKLGFGLYQPQGAGHRPEGLQGAVP